MPPHKNHESTTVLDKSFYAAKDQNYITVTDPDENQDPSRAESAKAVVSVWRQQEVEPVTLTETGPDTGKFSNGKGLPVSPAPSQPNDGLLQAGPGQVIQARYTDDDTAADQSRDQAMVEGGSFSYKIDESLVPSQAYALDPSRPVAVVVNPGGARDEYVVNELIANSKDPAVVDAIIARYNGELLHDGDLGGQTHKKTGYALVRVDPAKADMTNLERRMTALGFQGEFIFSSLTALQMGAIILEQTELQKPVTLNMMMTLADCPSCSSTQEGGSDNAFTYPWLSHPDLQVTRAWQFLDGLGIPDGLPSARRPFAWTPVKLGIIDGGGFATDPDWQEANVDDHACISFHFTPIVHYMSVCTDCCDSLSLMSCGDRRVSLAWHDGS